LNDAAKTSGAPAELPKTSGRTKVCAIIGDPVARSLSPPIHNAAFQLLGMDFLYVPFRVRASDLRTAIDGIRSLGIVGANVTMPHKPRVLQLLDTVDRIALEIGAVNTIAWNHGRLRGYNTDGQAALTILLRLGGPPSGRRAIILGAGGAARAIAYYISKIVESLVVFNRTRAKGSRLARDITRWGGITSRSYTPSRANLRREVGRADLLINTLPVDVFPRFGRILNREHLVGRNTLVFDVNYTAKSDFLAEAELAGAKVADGLDMLIGQAALSFKLWTGRDAPIDVMRQAAIEARGQAR